MKIHEILDRDPLVSALANEGQARISGDNDQRAMTELRAELETFVCDGEFGAALEKMLASFLQQLDRGRQNAAWVSGFFGSGKSHLLKMLGHLWVDTKFEDGATARTLVRNLPTDVQAHLRELDIRAARLRKPLFAAAGALPSGSREDVRAAVLEHILRACGLPEKYTQAQFVFWLRDHGHLEAVRNAVKAAGKDWLLELNNLWASSLLADAILAVDPTFARDKAEARQVLRDRFPRRTQDLTTGEFLAAIRAALAHDGVMPLSIVVLDEVQQFIGASIDRSVLVTEISEAIQTQLDSRVLLVCSGQSALTSTELLQRLRDRFRITVQLSDTDVEAVTRKVLLHKKPTAETVVRDVLSRNAGEISKHLQGTRLAERVEDRQTIEKDYPLLPTRRRFFEECFRRVDAAGTHSQLRSQLRILYEALRGIATRPIGAAIPASVLYDAIARDLVNTGVLSNEIETRIRSLDDGTPAGKLRQDICGLVFLINKLPRESAVDTGLRSTARIIADLLVDDLERDSGPFRAEVERTLAGLADAGTLMKVGEEYRIQTTEAAEWDRAFREKSSALAQSRTETDQRRDQLLAAAVQRIVSEIRLVHGDSKIRRQLVLHARNDAPPSTGDEVIVWLRDGFNAAQKDIEGEARRRGQQDAVLHVFLPRKSADDLRARIADAEAARSVLDARGAPTQVEGREARESMLSRLATAEAQRDEILRDIVAAAQVFEGGGTEVFGESLREKLETSAKSSLARLFPRFGEGDHRAWEAAVKRAKDGSDSPLVPVGWDRAADEHPIGREALAKIGGGARGGEIRKHLEGSPFGWPRDAIDAVLIAMHRAGTVRVLANNAPLAPGALDQAKIQSAEFRVEKVKLGTQEKIALRALFSTLGVPTKPNEEELRAPQALARLIDLAKTCGGDAPLPARASTSRIDDLQRLSGADQLAAILGARAELERLHSEWSALAKRADERVPAWKKLQELLRHAAGLPIAAQLQPEIDALIANRSLLADVDHVAPLNAKLSAALRAELTARHDAVCKAHETGLAALTADAAWTATDAAAQRSILDSVALSSPPAPAMKTDEDLARELARESLAARSSAAAAVPERVARALADAARLRAPKAQRIALRAATLADEAAVRAWLAEQEQRLLDAVKSGPVIVG
jgi:hypothetical protein